MGIFSFFKRRQSQKYKEQRLVFVKKLAENGNAKAQFVLGVNYFASQNYKEALPWFTKAAEQGYAIDEISGISTQNILGEMYAEGKGVPEDDTKAFKWFKKAAEQGYAIAQNNLGNAYRHGRGVPQDFKEAVKWWMKAAKQGNPDAQLHLANAYEFGFGVIEDKVQVYAWYNIYAANPKEAEFLKKFITGDLSPRDAPFFYWSRFPEYLSRRLEYAEELAEKGEIRDKSDIAEYLQSMDTSDLPNKYKAEFAEKMTKKQIAEAQKLSREMIEANPKLMGD